MSIRSCLRACLGVVAASLIVAGPVGADEVPPLPAQVAALGDSITTAWGSTGSAGDNLPASWATGSEPLVQSHYQRLLAIGAGAVAANYARPGKRVATDDEVLAQVVNISADTRYVLFGGGSADLCVGSHTSVVHLKAAAVFEAEFREIVGATLDGHPERLLFVTSIPDWYGLWERYQADPDMQGRWEAPRTCPLLFGSGADATTRAAVRDYTDGYNTALATVCDEFDNCLGDGGAAHGVELTKDDVSTYDGFHPSLLGQAKLAAATWSQSWFAYPVNTSPPSLSGTPQVGETLHATPGSWAGAETISFSFAWQGSSDGTTWVDIPGATDESLVLTTERVGQMVRVRVTASNARGTVEAFSAVTGPVAAAPVSGGGGGSSPGSASPANGSPPSSAGSGGSSAPTGGSAGAAGASTPRRPAVRLAGAGFRPPLQARRSRWIATVATSVEVENAEALLVRVSPAGRPRVRLPLLRGSRIGSAVTGYWKKAILAPAKPTTPVVLRLPSKRLAPGKVYVIWIVAIGENGQRAVVAFRLRAR